MTTNCLICFDPFEPKFCTSDENKIKNKTNILTRLFEISQSENKNLQLKLSAINSRYDFACKRCTFLIGKGQCIIDELDALNNDLKQLKDKLKDEFNKNGNTHEEGTKEKDYKLKLQIRKILNSGSSNKDVNKDISVNNPEEFDDFFTYFETPENPVFSKVEVEFGNESSGEIPEMTTKTEESQENDSDFNVIVHNDDDDDNIQQDYSSNTDSDFEMKIINIASKASKNKSSFDEKCLKCKKKFKTQNQLDKHKCATKTKNPSQKKVKKEDETEEIILCDVCGKSLFSRKSLAIHKKVVHEKRVEFKCSDCEFVTYYKNNLKLHIIARHKNPDEICMSMCEHCGTGFKRNSLLKRHILRVHWDGEKKFKCTYEGCTRSFSERYIWKCHMLSHKDVEKPYKCEICLKTFSRKSNYDSHVSLHSGARIWNCEDCKRSFTCKRYLLYHKMYVHIKKRSQTKRDPSKIEFKTQD